MAETAKKIAIIDHKPNTPAYDYLCSKSKICGRHCIYIEGKKI